jgi:hypothetical protein
MQATALPVGAPPWQDKITAVSTPSGILGFHGLPGLRRFENSDAEDPWQTPQATRAFQIQVIDALGRFLPCTFAINVPARGIATFADNSSPPWIENGDVPLFSAPSRAVPAGLAIVRAQLRVLRTGGDAALAQVEADYCSAGITRTARGLADEEGRVLLLFPYPEGQHRAFNSSPPGTGGGVTDQRWTLEFRFFHESTSTPAENPQPGLNPWPEFADYTLRLSQSQVLAWQRESPITPFHEGTLQFGSELNLGLIDLDSA